MCIDKRTRGVTSEFIRRALLYLACRWWEGGRKRSIDRRRAINHGVGRGRSPGELGPWVDDLFATTFFSDRRSRTNCPGDRLEFRRLRWAIKHGMKNAKKKIVLGPVPHHHLRRQRPLLSRDYPNQHLPVLREEVARGRLDPSQVNRPHDVQLIASSGELQARLNHEESAYRSWKDP
jgi:hypothetical protein